MCQSPRYVYQECPHFTRQKRILCTKVQGPPPIFGTCKAEVVEALKESEYPECSVRRVERAVKYLTQQETWSTGKRAVPLATLPIWTDMKFYRPVAVMGDWDNTKDRHAKLILELLSDAKGLEIEFVAHYKGFSERDKKWLDAFVERCVLSDGQLERVWKAKEDLQTVMGSNSTVARLDRESIEALERKIPRKR